MIIWEIIKLSGTVRQSPALGAINPGEEQRTLGEKAGYTKRFTITEVSAYNKIKNLALVLKSF